MMASHRYVELATALLPDACERLARYVAQESPTGDVEALNAMAQLLASAYTELGGDVERRRYPTGDHLLARFHPDADVVISTDTAAHTSAASGHLLVLGHHDTVWPRGQIADAMPYVDDGETIHGPGVFDMKGGLVVFEMALRVLAQAGTTVALPIHLVVTADEEVGSPTGRALVEEQLAGAVGVLGLEPPHPRGGLKTARHGSTRVRLQATGVEAHAALDRTRGVSAIDELVDQLIRIRSTCAEWPQVLCNVGTMSGGTRANVTAGHAEAELGLRFGDADSERQILQSLIEAAPIHEGAQVTADILTSRPTWPPASEKDGADWLFGHVRLVGQTVGQRVRGSPALGAADSNLAGATGVPTLDGFGPIGRGAHALQEQIRVNSLAERAALLAAVLAAPLPDHGDGQPR